MKRGYSIRRQVLSVTFLALLFPVASLVGFGVYHTHLVRLTEQGLISESIVIGEAWRDHWLEAQGRTPASAVHVPAPDDPDPWLPIEPMLDLGRGIGPPSKQPTRSVPIGTGPEWVAGGQLAPLMERTRRVTLSAARVLNTNGCVVATTGDDLGFCYDEFPEVKAALAGKYTSLARERPPSEHPPKLESISRGGTIRVFTALPILDDGKVIGVVRMSRTSESALKALWLDRRVLVLGAFLSLLMTFIFSRIAARAITKPVQEITAAAQAIARGEPRKPLTPDGVVPEEVYALSEALDTMTAQLSSRGAYISEFAANVSHELKTPLTSIGGAAELLAEGWQQMEEPERNRFLGNIRVDVERMKRLVTRLLQLARIQSAPAEAELVELRTFLDRLQGDYGSRLQIDRSRMPPEILIHREHLESAVRNLLDNAFRHGAGKPVDLALASEDGRVVFHIRDHGPGISDGNRKKIFDRFFTTERDRGGTGLGLSIVQAVAATRGGNVKFESAADETTFVLTL